MFLDALRKVFYRVVVSTESKRLAELLAGFTLFGQMPKCHWILKQGHLVPCTTKCKVRHTIRAQVPVSGNDHIHFHAGRLLCSQHQLVNLTEHLLRVTVRRTFTA